MRVAILGPGGVGGFLAAALVRAGSSPVLVAREETAAQLERSGLQVTSTALADSWSAAPEVVSRLDEEVDALVIATKADGLQAALERVVAPPRLVVPLLNGLDHLAPLRARFGGERVVAAAIRIQADRPRTGVIVQDSPQARIDLATDGPDVAALAAHLATTGVDVRTGGSAAEVLWAKLARLCAIASATTAFDADFGAIRADPDQFAALHAVARETAAVATAAGAPTDPERAVAELDALSDAQGSSLWRDVKAGRPDERDAILGAVLRAAERHGVDAPTVRRLDAQIAARAG